MLLITNDMEVFTHHDLAAAIHSSLDLTLEPDAQELLLCELELSVNHHQHHRFPSELKARTLQPRQSIRLAVNTCLDRPRYTLMHALSVRWRCQYHLPS